MSRRNLFSLAALLICLSSTAPARAQKLDHHDILLFFYSYGSDSTLNLIPPRFLSNFNPRGYNNQPSFISPNELYLTTQMPGDTSQTDIYSLDLGGRTRSAVTATPLTSEYSPQLMPGGKRFSAIRVEEDGTQRLWSFPLDRTDNGRPEFPAIRGVGYHAWLNDTLAALFIVGENNSPHVLFTAGLKGQKLQRIAGSVGRSLQALPNNRLAYVQKVTDQTWYLKVWDPKKLNSDIVVKMPVGSEDFTLLTDGSYLCGSGPRLYRYKPGRDTEWKQVYDLTKYGVRTVSRLAISRDGKLAVVVQ